MIIKGVLRPEFTHIFPAPVGVQKNPRFLRKFQICGLITLLLDIVCLARGVSGGFSPLFWSKIATFAHILRPEFGDYFGGSKSGQKMAKNGQNGQKWPKWAKMAKNGLFGGSLGKPPPPPFLRFKSCLKTPVFAKRAIFQDFWGGRFWGGQKGSFLGFSGDFWGGQKGVKKWPQKGGPKWPKWSKSGILGGFLGGSKMATFRISRRNPRLKSGFFEMQKNAFSWVSGIFKI